MSLLDCWHKSHGICMVGFLVHSVPTCLSNSHAWSLPLLSHSSDQSSSFPIAIPVNCNFLYWLLRISMICALLNPISHSSLSCEFFFPCPSAQALLIHAHSTTIPTSVIYIKFSIAANTLLQSLILSCRASVKSFQTHWYLIDPSVIHCSSTTCWYTKLSAASNAKTSIIQVQVLKFLYSSGKDENVNK